MNLEELKKKREELEKELAVLVATEKAETEGRLRTAAEALIAEVKGIGYRGYFYEMPVEGEMPWTITVSRKKASGIIARAGREIMVSKDGDTKKFTSCVEACKALGIEIKPNTNMRLVLERQGYTVTNVTAVTVKGEPVEGEPVEGEPVEPVEPVEPGTVRRRKA